MERCLTHSVDLFVRVSRCCMAVSSERSSQESIKCSGPPLILLLSASSPKSKHSFFIIDPISLETYNINATPTRQQTFVRTNRATDKGAKPCAAAWPWARDGNKLKALTNYTNLLIVDPELSDETWSIRPVGLERTTQNPLMSRCRRMTLKERWQ